MKKHTTEKYALGGWLTCRVTDDMWGLLTTAFIEATNIEPSGFQLSHSPQPTTAFSQSIAHNNFFRRHSSTKQTLSVLFTERGFQTNSPKVSVLGTRLFRWVAGALG